MSNLPENISSTLVEKGIKNMKYFMEAEKVNFCAFMSVINNAVVMFPLLVFSHNFCKNDAEIFFHVFFVLMHHYVIVYVLLIFLKLFLDCR